MAAKTIYWTGATDSVFVTAANWNDVVGVASGADVLATDTCVVPHDATVDITGFDHNAIDLGEAGTQALVIEKGSSVTVGSSTIPLIIGTTASALLDLRGSGAVHLKIAGDASSGAIYVGGTPNLHLASFASEETTDNLYIDIESGTVYIAWDASDHAEIDNIYVAGGGTVYIGESVTDTAAAAIAKLSVSGGTVHCRSAVAILTNSGGTVYQEKGDITTLYTSGGDTYFNTPSGVLTTGHLRSGTFSLEENTAGLLSASINTLNLYGDAKYHDQHGISAVGSVLNMYGHSVTDGNLRLPVNTKITTAAI